MITTTESAHRVVSDWYPHMLIKSLAMVDELVDELIKAKYIRRIATGNPKRPWRYIYHADERKRWQASAWETVKTALREDQKDHGKANSHEDGSRAVHFGEAVSKLPLAVLKLALAHLEATHGKKAVAGMKAVIDQVEGKRDPHVTDPSPPGIRRTATEMDIAAAVSEAVNTLPPGVKSSKTTADTESRMGVTEITTHSGVTLTVDPNTATLVTKGPADKQEKLKSDPVFMAILAHVRGLLAKIRGIEAAPAKAEPPLPELTPAGTAARLASLHADLRAGATIAVNGKNYRVESIYQKLSGAKEIDAQEGILGNGKTHKIVLPKSGTAGDVTIREMYPKWTPKGQAGDGAGKVVRVPISQVYPGTANDAHIEIAAAGTWQTTAERYAAASAELESAIDDVYGKRPPQSHRGTWQKGSDGEWKAKPSGTSGTPQVGDTIAVMNRKGRVGNMVVTSPPDARGLVSVVDPKKTAARATNVPAPATVDGNRALAREVRDRLTTADVNAMTPDQLNLARNAVVAGRDAGHLSPMEAATLLSRIDGAASKPAPVFTVAASPRPETTAIDPTPPAPDSTTRTFGTKAPPGGWTDADRVPAVPESVRESERQALAAHREKVAAHHARLYASARPGRTLTIGRHELTINSGGPDTKGRRLLSATGGRGANYMVIIPATSDGQVRMIDRTGNTTVHPLTDVRTDTMASPSAPAARRAGETVKHADTTPAEREAAAQRAELIAESDGRALARQRAAEEAAAKPGDVFAEARAAAKRTADSRPWSMSSSQYQTIAGTTAPHIAEISGVQRQRMSKRELAGYQADRDARSAAAGASHNAWKDGVVAAYRAGQIDLKTPELSRDAKDVILRERSNDAEAGHEEYRQKFQASVSKTPEKGDVMHHPLHGTVEITKVNKNSVSVNAVRDGKRTPVGTVDPNWLSYGPHDVMDAGGKARTGMEYKTVETRQAEHKEAVKKWEATKRDIQASAPKSDNPGKASAEDVLAHAVATKDAGAGVHKVIFPKDVATNLGISSVAARRHLEQLAEQGKLSHLGDNRYRVPYDTSPEAEAGRRASHTPAPKPGKTSYLDQLTAGVKKAAPSKPAPISLKLGESAQSFVEIYLTDPAHDGEFPGAMVRGPKGLSLVVDHEHAEAAAAWMTDAVNGLDDELVEDDRLPKHLRRLDADTRRIIRNTRDAGQKLTSMIWQQAKEQREREKAEKSQRRFKLTLSKSQAFVG